MDHGGGLETSFLEQSGSFSADSCGLELAGPDSAEGTTRGQLDICVLTACGRKSLCWVRKQQGPWLWTRVELKQKERQPGVRTTFELRSTDMTFQMVWA